MSCYFIWDSEVKSSVKTLFSLPLSHTHTHIPASKFDVGVRSPRWGSPQWVVVVCIGFWGMAESSTSSAVSVDSISRDNNRLWKGAFAVAGIMVTLVTYGLLQVSFLFYFIHLLAYLFMYAITVLGSLSLSLSSILFFNLVIVVVVDI